MRREQFFDFRKLGFFKENAQPCVRSRDAEVKNSDREKQKSKGKYEE